MQQIPISMNKSKFPILILLAVLLAACSTDANEEEVICTEEFIVIGVKVSGATLSDYYTVRVSNNDTIRFTNNSTYPIGNWYPILDDTYQTILENTEEDFIFYGKINDATVVNEAYIIGADQCHIKKISGASQVSVQ
jgi:hypothetical protein